MWSANVVSIHLARVVELHLQKPRVAGLDRNYEVCYNLRTFSCKDYVYHFANASPAYSGELDRHNILKVADSCLTDALFISNTTILVSYSIITLVPDLLHFES